MDDKTTPTISFTGIVMFLVTAALMAFVIANIADSFFPAPAPTPIQEVDEPPENTQEIKEFGAIAYLPQAYSKIYSDDKEACYQTDDGRFLAFCESLDAPLFISVPEQFQHCYQFSDRATHEMTTIYEDGDQLMSARINRGTEEIMEITKAKNDKDPFKSKRTTQRMANTTTTYCFAKDGRCIIVDAPADEVATILHSATFGQL